MSYFDLLIISEFQGLFSARQPDRRLPPHLHWCLADRGLGRERSCLRCQGHLRVDVDKKFVFVRILNEMCDIVKMLMKSLSL